jgi:pimeloyl-ACP methyl ester carboxylesterase
VSLRRGAWRRLCGGAAAAALGLALAAAPVAVRAVPPAAATGADALRLSDCRLPGLAHTARCGSLRRPLDAAQPQGQQIEVQVVVLPALARHKAEDPVFFFVGGPGQSAIDLAGVMAARFARLSQRRDLVFVDQRGTGRSAPLKCLDDEDRAALRPLAEQLDEVGRLRRLQACRVALQALPHGDLRHYTTVEAVADIDAVRQALGAPRIDAIGVSYGTRVVLDYQRQFPQRVRRSVLDGVAPPDMRLADAAGRDQAAAFDAVLAACAAEPACARRHPHLRAKWVALLASLPRAVDLPHPVSGHIETVMLDRAALQALARAPLYAPALAAALPAAIAEGAADRLAPLAALAGALGGGAGGLASGMHFSVVCAEDMNPAAPPPAGEAGDAARDADAAPGSLAAFYRQACADWPRGLVPAAFYTLPSAVAPTWLLSGALDPVTPPRHAERVARALGARARHIVAPNTGHGVSALGCVRDAITRFITTDDDAVALAVDADCAARVPRPPAFVPPGADAPPAAEATR